MDKVAAALRDMLGADVGVGVTPARAPADLWPDEAPAVARAIPARRAEFAAGRLAARQAMADINVPPVAILQGADRAPLWPDGLSGSIAHCDSLCIAAVADRGIHPSLGIDIEPATPLDADLIPVVCAPSEQTWLAAQANPGLAAKMIFGAKEAVYKAQYPLTGQVIGFDAVTLTKSVFVVDGNRITTAGGTASIDLMLKLIAEDNGEDLANLVADQLIYSSIRTDQDTQRLSIPTRIGVRHPKLGQVIRMMEQNIEDPISPAQLAQDVGMSTRQLERLFRRYLNRSPKRYYMELRLGKARNLLMQTDMSVINVALACGFASPSHFSKCYRAHYDTTPYRERGSHAARIKT